MHSPDSWGAEHSRPRLAVSSCLLGRAVRYDGRHKRHDWLVGTLGRCVDFIPLCSEVSIGLGIPREPVQHLTGDPEHPRVRAVSNPDRDVTDALKSAGRTVAATHGGVAGYVFKSRSPSCGLFHVSVLTQTGSVVRSAARGSMPVPYWRAVHTFRSKRNAGWMMPPCGRTSSVVSIPISAGCPCVRRDYRHSDCMDFHARHKYLLMAHSPDACRYLGRLLSNRRVATDLWTLAKDYLTGLTTALMQGGGASMHFNVLQHILVQLERHIAPADRAELLDMLETYRQGHRLENPDR